MTKLCMWLVIENSDDLSSNMLKSVLIMLIVKANGFDFRLSSEANFWKVSYGIFPCSIVRTEC